MTFNINDNVKVRLTEYGHEILKQQYDEAVEKYPALKGLLHGRYQEDAQGLVEFALWDLMYRFGKYVFNGCNMPFETIVRIDEKDLGSEVREVK